MIYYTSDQHYYHENIIYHCSRPFKNVSEMNNTLIENHNKIVNKTDVVYHLGDFIVKPPISEPPNSHHINKILRKLNGVHILILGNHDKAKPFTYVECGFMSVHTAMPVNHYKTFVLVHDPAISQIDVKTWFLCGHIHTLFKKQRNVINVGVDVWNYKPVSLEQIRNLIKEEKNE